MLNKFAKTYSILIGSSETSRMIYSKEMKQQNRMSSIVGDELATRGCKIKKKIVGEGKIDS